MSKTQTPADTAEDLGTIVSLEEVKEAVANVKPEILAISDLDLGSDTVDTKLPRFERAMVKKYKYFAELDGIKAFYSLVFVKTETGVVKTNPQGKPIISGLQVGIIFDVLGSPGMLDSIYIKKNPSGNFFWIVGDAQQTITGKIKDVDYEQVVSNMSAVGTGDSVKYFDECRFNKLTPAKEGRPKGGIYPVFALNMKELAPVLWAGLSKAEPIVI
jgi:hypothetical protein